ncbi:MAG: glycoside hydrolase family 16 protein, partial [Rubrobacteraceae bacterium]
ENELDIEIFNDPSGRVMFTTYSDGKETNNVEKKLPFDPTEDFHEYRFDFYPGRVEFYVDGGLLHRFTEGLPEDPMRLYVNAWFPTWLSGRKPEADGYTYVDWLKH